MTTHKATDKWCIVKIVRTLGLEEYVMMMTFHICATGTAAYLQLMSTDKHMPI